MWVVGNIAGCTRAMIPVLRCMQIGPLNDSDSLVPGAKSGAKFLPSTLNPQPYDQHACCGLQIYSKGCGF